MMRYDEIDQTCAEITQLQATCQRLEAENAEGQQRIMELEAKNAELLAVCMIAGEALDSLTQDYGLMSAKEELAREALRTAIAKAKQEEEEKR